MSLAVFHAIIILHTMRKLQPEQREVYIQNAICAYLEIKGHVFWRSNNIPAFSRNRDGSISMRSMPKYTPKGLPDLMVIKNGQFYGLEVKRANTGQSEDQKLVEDWIKSAGGRYHVVRSIDEVQELGL